MKQVSIYQLPIESNKIFRDWEDVSQNFNLDEYTCQYTCEREDDYSEDDAFREFNVNRPADFKGHSLSVSDVVQIGDQYFFCDSFGWEEVAK